MNKPKQNKDINQIPFGRVIQKYRNAAKLNQRELAEKAGVSMSSVANWERERNLLSVTDAHNLATILNIPAFELLGMTGDSLPEGEEIAILNDYRLLSDKGKKVVSAVINALKDQEEIERIEALKEQYIVIPQQISPAAAGEGYGFDEEPPEPRIMRKTSVNQRADIIIKVKGDSMEPEYKEGDLVYVVCTQDFCDGDDVIACYHEGYVIKRYYNQSLHSLNKDREFSEKYEDDNIHVLGKVIGIVQPEDFPDPIDIEILKEVLPGKLQ